MVVPCLLSFFTNLVVEWCFTLVQLLKLYPKSCAPFPLSQKLRCLFEATLFLPEAQTQKYPPLKRASGPYVLLGPILETSPRFFHNMSLLMSSYTLSSPSSDLKGYLYVLLYVSLRNYCSFLESYITPESLTHLKQCISQCSC